MPVSSHARVLSVNIARPATLRMRGEDIRTGIFKEPVPGPLLAARLGLAGDFQVDRRFHGGPDKAIYVYPSEHYAAWCEELGLEDLPPGAFGENLTTSGLLEADLHTGDRLRVGGALLEVTKPRMPCYKLALKFGRPDMVKRMHANERSGFYASVVEEGIIEARSRIELVLSHPERASIPEIFRRKSSD